MHISSKAPLALALGAVLAVGAIVPASAFGGARPSLHGVGRGEQNAQVLQVRGGARYHKLQTERQSWVDDVDLRTWRPDGSHRQTGDTATRSVGIGDV